LPVTRGTLLVSQIWNANTLKPLSGIYFWSDTKEKLEEKNVRKDPGRSIKKKKNLSIGGIGAAKNLVG